MSAMSGLLRAQLAASLSAPEGRSPSSDPFAPLNMIAAQLAGLADYGRKYRGPEYVEAMEDALKIVERIRPAEGIPS